MDYLSDRTGRLTEEADNLELNDMQKAYIDRLLQLIADMAVMVDDAVDAIDELDMRLLEIEQQHENKKSEEPE